MNIKNIFKRDNEEGILTVGKSDKIRTTEELLQESKLSQSFYFMLVFSSIIVASGILLNNSVIILAGMLISPILKPILTLGLSVTIFNLKLFFRSIIIIAVSIILIIMLSFILATIHPSSLLQNNPLFYNTEFNILYFLINIFAGMAATLAWTKKREMTEILSGTAIAVSLVPPLSWIGISIFTNSYSNIQQISYFFLLNFLSILTGSVIIFLLSGFRQKHINTTVDETLKEETQE